MRASGSRRKFFERPKFQLPTPAGPASLSLLTMFVACRKHHTERPTMLSPMVNIISLREAFSLLPAAVVKVGTRLAAWLALSRGMTGSAKRKQSSR